MGVMDVVSSVGTSAMESLGNIEKAMIEVIDLRNRGITRQTAVQVAGANKIGGFGSVVDAGALVNKGSLNDYIVSMLGMDKNTELEDAYLKNLVTHKKVFTVQFNPSSLRLSGHSGGRMPKLDYNSDSAKEANNTPIDTAISLSVDLLFDSMDPQDAFMSDKISASPTNIGKGIANAALNAAGKKKLTIQRDVEGFIGAIRNEHTRLVTFHWGDMSYSGVLRSVGVEYTMFNVTGEPVRAVVALNIMCADASIWPNSVAVWQEQYKSAFEGGSESFVKTSQKIGNLLNL